MTLRCHLASRAVLIALVTASSVVTATPVAAGPAPEPRWPGWPADVQTDGEDYDAVTAVAPDGAVYAGASTDELPLGDGVFTDRALVSRIGVDSEELWNRGLGGATDEVMRDIAATTEIVYSLTETSDGITRIRALGSDGRRLWTRRVPIPLDEGSRGVEILVDGDQLVVLAQVTGAVPGATAVGGRDIALLRHRLDGRFVGAVVVGTPDDDQPVDMSVGALDVLVAGSTTVDGIETGSLVSIGRDDAERWRRSYPDTSRLTAVERVERRLVVGAIGRDVDDAGTPALVRGLSLRGAVRWTTDLDSGADDEMAALVVNGPVVYAVGTTTGVFPGALADRRIDVFVAGFDADGAAVGAIRQIGTKSDDLLTPHSAAIGIDGAIYIATTRVVISTGSSFVQLWRLSAS